MLSANAAFGTLALKLQESYHLPLSPVVWIRRVEQGIAPLRSSNLENLSLRSQNHARRIFKGVGIARCCLRESLWREWISSAGDIGYSFDTMTQWHKNRAALLNFIGNQLYFIFDINLLCIRDLMLFIHFAIGLWMNFTVIYTAIAVCSGRAELQIKIGRAIQSNRLSINCWFTDNSTDAVCYYALIDLFCNSVRSSVGFR